MSPAERVSELVMIFRYFASGDSMISISYAFHLAHNTVSQIINETCNLNLELFISDVLLVAPNQQCWINVAESFKNGWNLPHCVVAIDGKHVVIYVKWK